MISLLLQRGFPASLQWLSAAERERAALLQHPRRRVDFLLGRWAARRALCAVLKCAPDARIEVRPAASGRPEAFRDGAPLPVSISLSHREGLALAAVAPAGVLLGADLELIEPRSDAFVQDFFTAEEARAVREGPAPLRANLIWSAKESALKALGVGLRADTRSVEVRLAPLQPGEWQRFEAGALAGFWCIAGAHVVTVACAPLLLPRWIYGARSAAQRPAGAAGEIEPPRGMH